MQKKRIWIDIQNRLPFSLKCCKLLKAFALNFSISHFLLDYVFKRYKETVCLFLQQFHKLNILPKMIK